MTKKTLPRRWLWTGTVLGLQLSLLLLAGCSGSTKNATVSGKVNFKGQALPGGNITLVPADGSGQPVQIPIKADGTFQVSDIPPGMKKVGVETDSMKAMEGNTGGYKPPSNTPGKPPGDHQPKQFELDNSNQTKYMAIPKKYADPNTSGLTWEITKGKQEPRTFDLSD